jgi:hypothetical protein
VQGNLATELAGSPEQVESVFAGEHGTRQGAAQDAKQQLLLCRGNRIAGIEETARLFDGKHGGYA